MSFELSEEQKLFQESIAGVFSKLINQENLYLLVNEKKFNLESFFIDLRELGLAEYFLSQPETALLDLLILAKEQGRFLVPVALATRLATLISEASLDWEITTVQINNFSDLEKKSKIILGKILLDKDLKQVLLQDQMGLQLLEVIKSEEIDYIDLSAPKKIAIEFKHLKSFKSSTKNLNDLIILLMIAEALGACEQAFKLTNEYVASRTQFGVPVGGFQAVQHKLADTALMLEALNALLLYSLQQLQGQEKQLELSLNSLCLLASEQSAKIIENCIQCHGGIAFTWEYPLHLYLRRVQALVSAIDPCKIPENIINAVI